MEKYPPQLTALIEIFKKLPGVGTKSAERFAFHLLSWSEENLEKMGDVIRSTKTYLRCCPECGCLADPSGCLFCQRSARSICVVAHPKDVFAIEKTHEYRGLYHVLGGHLSPLEGRGPDHLSISKLKERVGAHHIQEVVIALDSTLEGDATALYLKEQLENDTLEIFRLAFGLPMGSSLDYVDGGTLARAFRGRLRY